MVCNCGPLVALAGAGQLGLLPALFDRLLVPGEVWEEFHQCQSPVGMEVGQLMDVTFELLPCQPLIDPLLVAQLDRGEAAVITAASGMPGSRVLMDERKGRRIAERVFMLPIMGTGGVLILGKRRGLLPAVRPVLLAMRKSGYYLSDGLISEVCKMAGE